MDDQKYKDIMSALQILSICIGFTMVLLIGVAWKLKVFFWQ